MLGSGARALSLTLPFLSLQRKDPPHSPPEPDPEPLTAVLSAGGKQKEKQKEKLSFTNPGLDTTDL